MGLATLLQPDYILLTCLLALSIFNLVAFLWLAFTVWLNGDRKSGIARLGVVGLGLSALFFYLHALLIAGPLTKPTGLVSQDFLWHLIWLPALGVPYIWFAIGLYYAALINQKWRKRRPYLLAFSALLGGTVLVLLLWNQSTFTYAGALRLIIYNNAFSDIHNGIFSPPVLLSLLFLCYVTFCAIAPWFTFGRIGRLLRVFWHYLTGRGIPRVPGLRHALVDAFWDDPRDKELMEEPHLSWHLARPGLLLAALLMALLTTSLGVLVIQSIILWLHHPTAPVPPEAPANVGLSGGNFFPLNLLIMDLCATGAVALVILLIGYSIVRHGILIQRSLSRRGFFEQWRGTVIVSTGVAIFIALLVNITRSNLGSLLLITSLATGAYALFTWSSYTAHDRYIAMLGPFVRSTSLRHWLNTDLQKTEQDLEHLFYHLCQNVLAVQCAYLVVLAGAVRRRFSYRWPTASLASGVLFPPAGDKAQLEKGEVNWILNETSEAPSRIQLFVDGAPMICWVLPIHDERGLVATLYLGPREDGGALTDEDMNLAHACGQRILDTLGDHEAMQAVAGLLRRRIVDVKLLGAQQRRVLHDEILPQMHLALLRLETLRSHPGSGESSSPGETGHSQTVDETIALISDTHRHLAAMMRATAPSAPHRLEQDGMISAIRTMLEQDFQFAFDEVEWRVSEETALYIDEVMPPAIAELVFAAVQEALRNAARHARGADEHRHLRLVFKASRNKT
ncbi:MAG: hypothetical protein NVS3B14_02930 [Ktedonobacteraceae bacterium]